MSFFYFRALKVLGSTVFCFFILFCIPALAFFGNSPKEVSPQGDAVRVPVADITAKASYFFLPHEGKKVVFFLVRDAQGAVHLALDACDACWREGKGYTQEGDVFICNNCGMRFHTSRIGLRKGGCNPHPVPFTEEAGQIVIPLTDLQKGTAYFLK